MQKFLHFKSEWIEFRTHRPIMILKSKNYKTPLIQCITNFVTVNDCANIILAAGASPSMAHDIREVEEAVESADALVCNLGAIEAIDSMILAGKRANKLNIPVILDPVACGNTSLRRESIKRLLDEVKFTVIRGNASEIKYLAGLETKAGGVDVHKADEVNRDNLEQNMLIVQKLARKLDTIIVQTGKIDIIASDELIYLVDKGSKTMAQITGSGCMLTSLIGALIGAYPLEPIASTLVAVNMMNCAGEIAQEKLIKNNTGNASFRTDLIDAVYKMIHANQFFTLDDTCYINKIKNRLLLYAITDSRWLKTGETLIDACEEVLEAGATILQIREKDLDSSSFETKARKLRKLCSKYNVPLIVNDSIEIAKACKADGVHLGQSDIEGIDLRKEIGDEMILGISAGNVKQAQAAERAGANYIGVGAMFQTGTKEGAKNLRIEELKAIVDAVNIPVVAIGGINATNISKLKDSGIDGVAVVSAIFAAKNLGEETRKLKQLAAEVINHR